MDALTARQPPSAPASAAGVTTENAAPRDPPFPLFILSPLSVARQRVTREGTRRGGGGVRCGLKEKQMTQAKVELEEEEEAARDAEQGLNLDGRRAAGVAVPAALALVDH